MQGKWRFWVLAAVLLAAVLTPTQAARSTSPTSIETASLQDTLEKGLKARFPREFKFIAEVVKLVEKKVLPLPMVMGTFQWAREKEKKQERKAGRKSDKGGLVKKVEEFITDRNQIY